MQNREQGCADQCGWHGIAADLGIVVIAAVTLTMAAANHQARTREQIDYSVGNLPAWQADYHILSPTPLPMPTGWLNESRPDTKPVVDLQWDCELLIDAGADAWKARKTPTSRATHQDDRSYLRVYSPGVNQSTAVALVVEHQHQRTRKRD